MIKASEYMRARYYDPTTGRFISEAPAGLVAGVNLYAYVGGNPVSRNDPNGLHFGLSIIGTPIENNFPCCPNQLFRVRFLQQLY